MSRQRLLALVLPPLALLALGLSGKAAAAFILPASPLAGYNPNWHSVLERSFWVQADLFAFGMLVAVAHTEIAAGRLILPPGWRRWAAAAGVLVFLPCAATMGQAELSYVLQNTGEALGISLLFATIVLPHGSPGVRSRGVRLLEWPPLVSVGVVSYSLFLWHEPLIIWLREHGLTLAGWDGMVVNLALTAVIAGALSALTYRWVELPALRRKRSTRPGARPAPEGEEPDRTLARA